MHREDSGNIKCYTLTSRRNSATDGFGLLEELLTRFYPSTQVTCGCAAGVAAAFRALKLGEGLKGVYISVDLDCMDPAFAPEVSHIEPGGLSFCDVLNILYNLQADVDGADVVKFNPQRDTVDGMTAVVAAKLVRKLTAKISK
ncbi:hypothetical protein FXO38_16268 [Capsicum annuum]|nr:hypothetical protein FXO38_16268 [Capsicum annuum]